MIKLIVTGEPDWITTVRSLCDAQDWTLIQYMEQQGYISRLAADHPALILVDGGGQDWQFWATTARTRPAARRIPIVVVSADSDRRAESLRIGAQFAMAPDDILLRLPSLIAEHGRVQSESDSRVLAKCCDDPLPEQGRVAVRLFNAGKYYEQHDIFEALWVAEENPVRDLYRAVLQVGVAYYQIVRGKRRAALKMLIRSRQWFHLLPDVCQGIDIARLRDESWLVYAALEASDDLESFDRTLLKPIILIDDPA